MNNPMQWNRSKTEFQMILFGYGLIGWLFLGAVLESIVISLAVVLALMCIIYLAFGRSLNTFQRMYFVTSDVADRVVRNVLELKNLPYKRLPHKYQITGVNLFITIKPVPARRERPSGVKIQVGPVDGEEMPLIVSLREKLDEAFLPRGLD